MKSYERLARRMVAGAALLLLSLGCRSQETGPVVQEARYLADPDSERVKTILFATIAPDLLYERADFFAQNGMHGFMMAHIMASWQDDIWKQPTVYTPHAPAGRVVGEANLLLQKCRRTNQRCRELGIEYNSVKVAFYKNLPDWFDDAAWRALCENFYQCAVFSRMAQFSGITLDIEYIAEMYHLDYPAYQAAGYPRDRLRSQAHQRGYELMSAMIKGFPDMIFWLLPECMTMYGPLASDLFSGMVSALAEKDSPGGIHVCTEGTYTSTKPRVLFGLVYKTDVKSQQVLTTSGYQRALDYWRRRGSISPGLWPLGYYREILDAKGNRIGYAGKKEKFGDRIIGSYADKSENYSVEEFQRQYAAGRLLARRFVWIYCHGQVFWQLSKEEMERFHATAGDTLPVVENLQDYLTVMRHPKIVDDSSFANASRQVREHRGQNYFTGFAPNWRHLGPFAFDQKNFAAPLAPEKTIDLQAEYATLSGSGRWQKTPTDSSGYVDLAALYGNQKMPIAYSLAWLESAKKQPVPLGFGCNDCATVFVNGKAVFHFDGSRNAVIDEDIIPITLPAGRTQILVKCGDRGGSHWGFYLRIMEQAGKNKPEVRWMEP